MTPSPRIIRSTASQSGPWTLVHKGAGAELCYRPRRAEGLLTLELSASVLAKVKVLARKADAAAIRELLVTPEVNPEVMRSAALSSVVSTNTWRWAVPLLGGPLPAGRARGRQAKL
jgi:hypothetical protein